MTDYTIDQLLMLLACYRVMVGADRADLLQGNREMVWTWREMRRRTITVWNRSL